MKKNKTIDLLDFLKGFSMFTIVIFHLLKVLEFTPLMQKAIYFGGTGVHTFILVSGFGLYLSFIKKPMTYWVFMKKRFIKVYIPYIIVVTVIVLISLFIPIYKSSFYSYLGHVFLYKMFDDNIIGSYGDHFWFISTIIQFYIVFPFLVKWRNKLSLTGFFLTGLFVSMGWIILILLISKEDYRTWNSFFLQYLWEFNLGMILAEIYLKRNEFWTIKTKYLALIAAIGLLIYGLLAIQLENIGKLINDIPALIGYTCFAILIFNLRIKLINNFLLFTGAISYSLYLVHIAVRVIIVYLYNYYNLNINFFTVLLMLVISYFIAFYFNLLIKKFYALMKY